MKAALDGNGIVKDFESLDCRKDGQLIWTSTNARTVRDANGAVLYYEGFVTDITDRKRAEAEIRWLNAGLEQRVAERTAQLRMANQELESFAYSVSHDLRSPLRSLDGYSQVLVEDYEGKLDDSGRHYLQRIRASAHHMSDLIDALLKLSRVTRSEMQLDQVDMSALARTVINELRLVEPERQVMFKVPPRLVVKADQSLMRIAMNNLLGNAWKFTSKHASALIEVGLCEAVEGETDARRKGKQVFFVRDDGAGFDMTYADKLFGAFQRLHGAKEFEGTGIGLAMVQRIIHRHGGQVWAEGAVEQGVTIYFTLS
jgi:light-regulated signal transduction histidine kinase (bacteriophytochrome)